MPEQKRLVVRADLPHDERVSDLMEKLISEGVPIEIAAQMAEDVVGNLETRERVTETVELMVQSLHRSRQYQRLHFWAILICVVLALVNAIAALIAISDILDARHRTSITRPSHQDASAVTGRVFTQVSFGEGDRFTG